MRVKVAVAAECCQHVLVAEVLGPEFNVTADDKVKAQGATTTINIGTIGSFAENLGAGNTSGDIAGHNINFKLVADIASQLRSHLGQLEKDGATSKRCRLGRGNPIPTLALLFAPPRSSLGY